MEIPVNIHLAGESWERSVIMPTPVVSVVVSTYNRQKKLARALLSAINQSLKDIEIIVVDNASTDGTEELVRQFHDPRVRYIRHEANAGGGAARNTGIRAAGAEYIALLDDDDQWSPQKLEKQIAKMRQAPVQTGLVYVGTEIYDEHKSIVRQVNHPHYRGEVYQQLLLGTILGSVTSVLVKKECFIKSGLFDETLTSCQDWDMWLRIAQHFEFDFVDEILARINMHGEQISMDFSAMIPGRTRMVEKHWLEFEQHPDIFVVHLKRIGKLHFLNGTWKEGLTWFAKAIGVRKTEIIKITAWLLLEFPFARFFSAYRNFKKFR